MIVDLMLDRTEIGMDKEKIETGKCFDDIANNYIKILLTTTEIKKFNSNSKHFETF